MTTGKLEHGRGEVPSASEGIMTPALRAERRRRTQAKVMAQEMVDNLNWLFLDGNALTFIYNPDNPIQIIGITIEEATRDA